MWDSTRALLPLDDALNAFALGQEDSEDALVRTRDDVFPYQVEITLALARTGQGARTTELTAQVEKEDRNPTLSLRSTRFLSSIREKPLLIKVGHEWMEVGSILPASLRITKRGVRDSAVVPHKEGEPVRFGVTFRRVGGGALPSGGGEMRAFRDRPRANARGFTLFEVMAALAIFMPRHRGDSHAARDGDELAQGSARPRDDGSGIGGSARRGRGAGGVRFHETTNPAA